MNEHEKNTDIGDRTFVIGKLGGSVITDKARLKTVHVSGDARELSGALAALEANTKGNSR